MHVSRIRSSFVFPCLESSSVVTPNEDNIVPLEVTHFVFIGRSRKNVKANLAFSATAYSLYKEVPKEFWKASKIVICF